MFSLWLPFIIMHCLHCLSIGLQPWDYITTGLYVCFVRSGAFFHRLCVCVNLCIVGRWFWPAAVNARVLAHHFNARNHEILGIEKQRVCNILRCYCRSLFFLLLLFLFFCLLPDSRCRFGCILEYSRCHRPTRLCQRCITWDGMWLAGWRSFNL